MVLLASAICTKNGKALVSRQFVEMTRSRIEGLLASFPKLISGSSSSSKQHTFVETESVRYVYQPLEKLYMLLITTKASNILEDLETLRLFSRVIPEYCKTIDEKEINEHAFDLLFAFDEIVALGYRENVNLAQIRTFTDMESHEERLFQAMRETQEREAKQKMLEKAEEIRRSKVMAEKMGRSSSNYSGGFGSSSMGSGMMTSASSASHGLGTSDSYDSHAASRPAPSYTPAAAASRPGSKAMKLGSAKDQMPAFIEQVRDALPAVSATSSSASSAAAVHHEKVHVKVDEKISLTCDHNGGIQNMEVLGVLSVRIASDEDGRIKVAIQNQDSRNLQLQTNPNVDKKLFTKDSVIGLKDSTKSFPTGNDVGVLKWRFQTTEETEIPLTINCWPSETKSGCDVSIEFELQKTNLELNNVTITIPIPSNVAAPIIKSCDGDYTYEKFKNCLFWRPGTIDSSNATGSLEFSVGGHESDFFPVHVNFTSNTSYCDIQVTDVTSADNSSAPVKYSSETVFSVDKYEIV